MPCKTPCRSGRHGVQLRRCPAPAPSLFADKPCTFSWRIILPPRGPYEISGHVNWDLTTASPAAVDWFVYNNSTVAHPRPFRLTGIGGASIQAVGNLVDLMVPVGRCFCTRKYSCGTDTADLILGQRRLWHGPYIAATVGDRRSLYNNPPSPDDAFGLPSNGPWIVATASYLPGDVNFDGIVNGLDIADVASHWLQTGNPGGIAGDANFDGVVNGLDISVIASHWLATAGRGASGATVPEPSTLILACTRRIRVVGLPTAPPIVSRVRQSAARRGEGSHADNRATPT